MNHLIGSRARLGWSVVAVFLLATVGGHALGQASSWRDANRQDADWYATPDAVRTAENVLLGQRDNGGWHKNFDYTRRLSKAEQKRVAADRDKPSTIDNGGTTMEMIFLARVFDATNDARYRDAFLRGLDYLIEMQYDHGGWPQVYPLTGGYSDAITYNDDAMVRVLNLLHDIARREPMYRFVDQTRREQARAAVEKGVRCILDTQIIVDGRRTAWCAQHDEVTLEPTQARVYEHPSISGMETVPIIRFLMSLDDPGPRVIEAVQAAVRWLDQVKITGKRMIETQTNGQRDRVLVDDPDAPAMWARFYEVGTNRPIFSGRDGVIRYSMAEIEQERRRGYRWFTGRANALLEKEYPQWQHRHAPDDNAPAAR